ncbi:hypothetical protein FB451DRAFT_1409594 [Mycena latifolia]|nr:hypothetical protein FB451DRAFT_1409594 [Mycena latifolia]
MRCALRTFLPLFCPYTLALLLLFLAQANLGSASPVRGTSHIVAGELEVGRRRGSLGQSLARPDQAPTPGDIGMIVTGLIHELGPLARRRFGHQTTIFITTFTVGDGPFPTTDEPPPAPPSTTTTETATPSSTTSAVSSTHTTAVPPTSSAPSGSSVGPTRTSSTPATSPPRSTPTASSSAHSTAPSSSTQPLSPGTSTSTSFPLSSTSSSSASPELSSASPTPITASASSKFDHVPVLVGTLIAAVVLALIAALCIYRRRRLRREWDAVRVHLPEDGWQGAQAASDPKNQHTEPQHTASPMDSPWNGSDVRLLGPTDNPPPSPSKSHSASPSPAPSPSPVPVPRSPSPAFVSEKHDDSHASVTISRAPTFVTFDDRTPPTPPPHYSRPLPRIPIATAY